MNHTFRGVLTAWMVLIALRTVGTDAGSGRVASLFNDANALVAAALAPNVPAIRDRRAGAGASNPGASTSATGPVYRTTPLATTFDDYSGAGPRNGPNGQPTPF